MTLSDKACRTASPRKKVWKLSDGEGLQLWIQPKGSKQWRLAYRFGDKQKLLAIGGYPTISLSDARDEKRKAKRELALGLDPVEEKKKRLAERNIEMLTFRFVATEWREKLVDEGRAESTLKKTDWLLRLANDDLGSLPVANVKPADVLKPLRKIEKKGQYESARRLRSTIGSVMRYAVATARAETDPTFSLQGALTTPTVTPRPAITEPKGVGALLRVIDGYGGEPTTRAALLLMAYLFQRPGELRQAEWREVDKENAVWSIPGDRLKKRRREPHCVPLSRQAIEIFEELERITGDGRLIFPSVRSVERPISDNAMNSALRNMGYAKDEICPHGFRATASTLLNESNKWNPDAIERQLAHVEGNKVRAAYARGEHWDERVKMMSWWADYLDELRGTQRSNIVQLNEHRQKISNAG